MSEKNHNNFIVYIINGLCVLVSLALALLIRFQTVKDFGRPDEYILLAGGMFCLCVVIDLIYDYDAMIRTRGWFEEFIAVLKKIIVFMVILIVVLFLCHVSEIYSRLVLGYFALVDFILTYILHIAYKKYVIHRYERSRFSSRLLIVSTTDMVEDIADRIKNNPYCEKVIVGAVLLDSSDVETDLSVPVVSSVAELVAYVAQNEVDEVFVCDKNNAHRDVIKDLMPDLIYQGVSVKLNINVYDNDIQSKKNLSHVSDFAVVDYSRNFMTNGQKIAKRALDICGGIVGMLVLIIASIFIAPIIKLTSKGPVFFKQTRVGKNGRKFTFYKFRSMYIDAEERKQQLMQHNEVDGYMFKMKNDPRITKFGRFLRRTSLDELPQFWNILKGDMSLVGTRPPTVDEYEKYQHKYKCRLSMKPGLTGMWQVSGRSNITDFEQVIKLDMEYIDDWTLKKDIKILLQTFKVVICGNGAR